MGQDQRHLVTPVAAAYCYLTGGLSFCWAIACRLAVRDGEYDGILNAWWGLAYLAGAIATTLLAITSLVRREQGKLWAILCAGGVLLPLLLAFLG